MGLRIIGAVLPSVEEFAIQEDGASQASYTFSAVTLSEAGLFVVRFLLGGVFAATRTVSSVTVGGNAATIIQQNDGFVTLNSVAVGLAVIALSSGSSSSIVVTVAGGLNGACCAVQPVALYNLKSATEHAKNGAGVGNATSVSTTLDIPSGGLEIVAAGSINGSAVHTPTGYIDTPAGGQQIDTSWRVHSGVDLGMVSETGRTLISDSSLSTKRAIAAASWR